MGIINAGQTASLCIGESNTDSFPASSYHRPTRPNLYPPLSVRPLPGNRRYGRIYSTWFRPIVEYSRQQLQKFKRFWSIRNLRRMTRRGIRRVGRWLLEVEMGFVWGIAGLSIFIFVFAAIWYIDPALLTLVLRFRQATCTTVSAAFLIGVSNCSWTSCK